MKWLKDKIGQGKVAKALANASEEALYAQAAVEVAEGSIRAGLWAKALSAADGDERKAKARYIGLRVEQLELQLSAAGEIARASAESATEQPKFVAPSPRVQCMKCRGTNVVRRFAWYCQDCRCDLHGPEWQRLES